MDVCPKCHNQIVYGMNCCTGKRVLNIQGPPEPDLSPRVTLTCTVCGSYGWDHDQWKHNMADRVEALEKEVAALKQKGFKT